MEQARLLKGMFAEPMTVTTGSKHQEIHIDSCPSEPRPTNTLLLITHSCSDRCFCGVTRLDIHADVLSALAWKHTLCVWHRDTSEAGEAEEKTQSVSFPENELKANHSRRALKHSDRNVTLNDIIGEGLTLTPPLVRREAERSARCFGILTLV
ncbi:unnamed protein product [Leuciscus chuanchicus]